MIVFDQVVNIQLYPMLFHHDYLLDLDQHHEILKDELLIILMNEL
jgi:hypothetical protein